MDLPESAGPSGTEQLRLLAGNLSEYVVLLDASGRILFASPAAADLSGYSPEEREGGTAFDLVHPDDAARVARALAQVVAHAGSAVTLSCRIGHKDGGWRHIHARATNLLHEPAVAGILVAAHDITDQKLAEEQLRVERAYFYELFEGAPEAIAIVSGEDRVMRINSEFERTFGYPAEEAVGRRINELIVPDDLLDSAEALTKEVAAGSRISVETVRRRKDGELLDVSILSRPIRVAGASEACYAIYRDITEQKRSEQALRQSEQQLRQAQKMEAVGRLAGGIAHDFNNLLTAMTGHAELLLENDGLPELVRDEIEEIVRAGNRAVALTRQLLTFSRKQVVQPKVLDLDGIVRELEGMFRRLIGDEITLNTALGAGGARVQADRGQIEQVLLNLVLNARDAMAHGGRLSIETRPVHVQPGKAHIHGGVAPGRYLLLSVTDTGTGMDEETLSRAFEPFFTTKEPGKGTGLGLSTAYGIIAQAGGGIALESDRGHGTSVRVYLPFVDAAGAQEATVEPTTVAMGSLNGTETVLLAEDEPTVRSLARRILQRHGYTILEAQNGAAALHVAETHPHPIHLLLTDVVMPQINGRRLAERCRLLRPEMRVVFMSGYNEEEIMHHGIRELSMHLLAKPFSPKELASVVRAALDEPARDEDA